MSKVKLPRAFLPKRIAKKFSDNRNHFLYNSIPSQINRSSWFWRITYLIQYCPHWKLGFILIFLGWYSWIWFDIAHDISFKTGINFVLNLEIVSEAVVAEWLRRLTRNQIPSGSAGSSPADCVIKFLNDFSYE